MILSLGPFEVEVEPAENLAQVGVAVSLQYRLSSMWPMRWLHVRVTSGMGVGVQGFVRGPTHLYRAAVQAGRMPAELDGQPDEETAVLRVTRERWRNLPPVSPSHDDGWM